MARRDRRFGREVFNKFFLRENYLTNEAFEGAIQECLKNPYYNYGRHKTEAQVKITRNKHGARLVVYRKE